jgi:hypothetical protein
MAIEILKILAVVGIYVAVLAAGIGLARVVDRRRRVGIPFHGKQNEKSRGTQR